MKKIIQRQSHRELERKKKSTEMTGREHRTDSLKMITDQTQVTTLRENTGGEI